MALASTSVHVVDGAPQMAASSVCVPRVSSAASCPSGGSPRAAAASDPGSFQIIASALVWSMTFFMPPLSVDSVSHSPLALPKLSPGRLQIQKFWEILFM